MAYIPGITPISKGYNTACASDHIFVAFGGSEYKSDYELINFRLFNDDYKIEIDKNEYRARNCRVSAVPFNRVWPGHQRDFSQSEDAAFVSVYGKAPVTLTISCEKGFDNPVIRPLSKNVPLKMDEDKVVITLTEHGQYVLEPKDFHHALHIFFEEEKEYPEKENATYYFGKGIHFPGVITLKDNDSVYIDKEAIVFGSLYSEGAHNLRIYGGGTIDNTTEERICENCYENYTKGTLRLYNCTNVVIEDIILTNSSNWILALFESDNVTVDNVKIVGHWRYNTDGIDISNTTNVLIKNCFIRSFDDTITIKALYNREKPIENITVDNCVLWCGWGKNLEVGIETDAPAYKNITFKNSDLLHSSSTALDIQNGCGAEISLVTFENINVEYSKFELPEVLQKSDDEVYNANGKMAVPHLINIVNHKMAIRQRALEKVVRKTKDYFADVHDILFKNIRVFKDEEVKDIPITLKSYDENVVYKNIVIDGLYINGEKQENLDNFKLTVLNAEYELK